MSQTASNYIVIIKCPEKKSPEMKRLIHKFDNTINSSGLSL